MTPRTPAQNVELALLLEVAGTPKPGNVDRARDYPDLRFEHFLAGAVGAAPALRRAPGAPLGEVFEDAVAGMSEQEGGNTQFGALLLSVPLLYAALAGDCSPEGASAVVESTTVDDAVSFYRAFDHVDVAVRDPPESMDALDVRRGSDAEPELRARELTLEDVMARSADRDGIAAEWVGGFERTFRTAEWLLEGEGPVGERTSRVFLRLLAEEPDTFVVTRNSREVAVEVQKRAQDVLAGEEDPDELAEEFVERDVNPGTTADITAGALFVALEGGLTV